ncbi:DUF4296 domain-containing protein [Parapedobacter sp. 10938]|uniref:DUF4296 domain-containing protein n=1 Tax=Parapedobacter flavus TaxID=3110225 RepID=UPI002DBD722B|nr:DUF4296 domain-containing protein [Parapedobacter sp. 10938]MEC3879849.1 DUF4296 domain-containing protein [Parapedobacter sp. 10938]
MRQGKYMRLIIILLSVLIFSSACGDQLPEGVVPQPQMEAMLLDMHVADGQLASMMADSARVYRNAYYEAIFNRYAIDSTTFERSIKFYSSRPAIMKVLYIGIEKRLEAYNTAEQKAIEEKYSAQRRADSIITARRTDSLQKVARDSLDFKRKRYLLYQDGPDSLQYGQPVPVTYTLLRERMMEALGLPAINSLEDRPNAMPAKPVAPPPAQAPGVDERTQPALKPIKKIK